MNRIFPLSEGEFTIGHDKVFMPFSLSEDELTDRPTGSLLVEIQPFLIETGHDLILLDTGLGFKNDKQELQIHANIRQCGFEPEQITKVLLSHLHKDHAGGATYINGQGIRVPSFARADYFIYRREAEYALEKGFPSYIPEEVEPLLSSGQVQWLDGEEGKIGESIQFFHSGGHCPEHIVFLIDTGKGKIFYGGDEAPQIKQMKMKYVAKYDFDGKKAMELRARYAEQGREEGWEFLFYHDVKCPVSRL